MLTKSYVPLRGRNCLRLTINKTEPKSGQISIPELAMLCGHVVSRQSLINYHLGKSAQQLQISGSFKTFAVEFFSR